VAAEAVTARLVHDVVEAIRSTHERILAVGAHDQICFHKLPVDVDAAIDLDIRVGEPYLFYSPKAMDSKFLSTDAEKIMQESAAYADAGAFGEIGGYRGTSIKETNAAKTKPGVERNGYAQAFQNGNAVGHQALAAGLFNRQNGMVNDSSAVTSLRDRDRGCQSSRTATKDARRFELRPHEVYRFKGQGSGSAMESNVLQHRRETIDFA